MNRIFGPFFALFRNHKAKMFVFFFSFVISAIVLFPWDDVGDLIAVEVAQQTNNQIFLRFDSLGLSASPTGIRLNNVYIETPMTPPLSAAKLAVAPSWANLFAFRLGVSASLEDFLGGNIDLSAAQKSGKKDGSKPVIFSIETKQLNLGKVLSLAGVPFLADGNVMLQGDGEWDLALKEQPDFKSQIQVQKVSLPVNTVPTMMGPLALPDMQFRSIRGSVNMKNGILNIENLNVGESTDEMAARVSGQMDIRFVPQQGTVSARPGRYNLNVQLQIKDSFKQKAGFFLTFIKKYEKEPIPGGSTYSMKISGSNFYSPPNIQ